MDLACAIRRVQLCSRARAREGEDMKSAYELAMERLEKSAPTLTLTDAQKAQMAEIDSTYKARIAEKELFLQGKIREVGTERAFRGSREAGKAAGDGNPAAARGLRGEKGKAARELHEVAVSEGGLASACATSRARRNRESSIDVASAFLGNLQIVGRSASVAGSGGEICFLGLSEATGKIPSPLFFVGAPERISLPSRIVRA